MKKKMDWGFCRRIFAVAAPIIIQDGITNFVGMLDNIMVGQVGTLPMSGVAIVNQLLFVFYLTVFGAMAGAGIFTAQFFGSRDTDGVRFTHRYKLMVATIIAVVGIALFALKGRDLIGLYLESDSNPQELAATMEYGWGYLKLMLWGLVPMALTNAYCTSLRETGYPAVPMMAGVSAVLVNLVLNYVLIFGHFGAPVMGVNGAAIATVVSRFVELAIVAGWTHMNPKKNPFVVGVLRSMYIPGTLVRRIVTRGMPLLVNEALWSLGMATMNQCYSVRGLDVVAGMNIASTITHLISVFYLAMGNSVGILMGQLLGAGIKEQEIRTENRRMITLIVSVCLFFGALLLSVSGLFPKIYNTTDQVRGIATGIICIGAVLMPFNAYNNATYFTLRAGGQTFITFLFDSVFTWGICVPVAFCLSRFTDLTIFPLYGICASLDLLKICLGTYLLKKGVWINRLVV